jgi:hypothetical protein
VALAYKYTGTWGRVGYTYTEAGSPTPPAMLTPSPLSTLTGSNVTFNWDAGAGPVAYQLRVGTTGIGSSDIYNGSVTTALSAPVSGIPTNGATVYVALAYKVGGTWTSIGYTYTEAGSATPPAMVTPSPLSTLTGSSVTFNWNAGAGPVAYQLRVGTSGIGSSNIYNGSATTGLSTMVSGIPTNGATVYVALAYKVSGTWTSIGYTYTEANGP